MDLGPTNIVDANLQETTNPAHDEASPGDLITTADEGLDQSIDLAAQGNIHRKYCHIIYDIVIRFISCLFH